MASNAGTAFTGFRRNGLTVSAAMAVALAVCLSGATPAEGNQQDDVVRLRVRAELEELMARFARTADTVGRGRVEEGRALAHGVFIDDFLLQGYLPEQDMLSDPPTYEIISIDNWIDTIKAYFDQHGYFATHHQIGNLDIIEYNGDTVTFTAYVTATHVLDPYAGLDICHGLYRNQAIRTANGWRIVHEKGQCLTLMRLEAPPP